MNKYTSAHVANYFLSSAYGENIPITPLKLMKLVYFAYAWYLYFTDEKLYDEDIQAWKHGPVIPSLYHEFKHYGLYGDIRGKLATYIDLANEDAPVPEKPSFEPNELVGDFNKSICGVWYLYKHNTGDELEEISHQEESVWSKYYIRNKNNSLIDNIDKQLLIKERAKTGYEKARQQNSAR